ncbi:MAG: hypothetical protein HC918_04880 [Oscillatoriales cyanobacterium SM2_1_8]|nr:hypothetical protein [Oscillatoriales cyanobacterium SM2_1_8]
MAPNNLLELARQGNVKVIAALLNRLLKSQNMLVAVSRSDRLLDVEIETDGRERIRVPNREVLTTTLQKWLLTIGVNVPRLRVSWRPAGSEAATWVQECDLMVDLMVGRSEQDVLEEVARTTDLTALDQPKASDDLLADLTSDLTSDLAGGFADSLPPRARSAPPPQQRFPRNLR